MDSSVASQPIEVGMVRWQRELNDALAAARDTGKLVFALFQEVPGCAGCKQFGAEVLSDPGIVDAIEELFVPLLIHNNKPGRDAEVLAAYGEPSWNFQVVRFLDAEGADVIARRDRVWETGPLAARMIEALETSGREAPAYLRLIDQEHNAQLITAHFVQPCFWVGEMQFGQIDGVVRTEAGFMGGHEITTVDYDPRVVSLESLTAQGRNRNVADAVYVDTAPSDAVSEELRQSGVPVLPVDRKSHRVAPASDQKRQANHLNGFKRLSQAQQTKLNAFAPVAIDEALAYLPPTERRAVTKR